LATPPQNGNREDIFDTAPVIPEPTLQKLALFAREPIVPGRIIFLGDSITEMGDWKKVLNDSTVINRGIAGAVTRSVLRRLKDITDRNPSKVFILLGINDIGRGIPDGVIAGNYLKIIGEIHNKCPKTIIYVHSVLPVNPGLPQFPRRYYKHEQILALNKLLSSHAKEGNYKYVDIFPLFADGKGLLGSQYTYDGIHLKQPAYPIWVDYLRELGYLQEAGAEKTAGKQRKAKN
jgi:lysophospholipase L1-like esterase